MMADSKLLGSDKIAWTKVALLLFIFMVGEVEVRVWAISSKTKLPGLPPKGGRSSAYA